MSVSGREIVIGVSGGIAAYKTAALVSLLVQRGAGVSVVMTKAATKFVAPGTGGVPESAFTTTAARWLYRKDPSRFSRAGLTALEQHMSNRARAFQRALPDAPPPGDEE